MFRRPWAAESLGMPTSKPFAWFLAAGMLCSLAGLAFTRLQAAPHASAEQPASVTSAVSPGSSAASNASPTVVTQESPAPETAAPAASTPSPEAAVANLVASPTAASPLEPAPLSTVQAMPSSLREPVELVRVPDRARGLLDAMNTARVEAGLSPLEWDASLEEVAYARARNLVENGYFDHYAPDGESAFSELAARGIRYRLAGENLARNNYSEARTVAAAFEGLMNSPGHRANILEPRFSSVGVAAVREGRIWIYVTVFLN